MKKLIALLIAALMLFAAASAQETGYLDYTEDVAEDGSLVYYFGELKLTLPADWLGKVTVFSGEMSVSFFHKASYVKYLEEGIEGGGFLFSLSCSVNSDFSDLPAFTYLGFSEESALNYFLILPSDYPAWIDDEEIREEWDSMYEDIDRIAQSAEFYTDELVEDAEDSNTESEASAEATAPSLHDMRYFFEHSALPRYFHEDPQQMIDALSGMGPFMVWSLMADENSVANPYTEADFAAHKYVTADGVTVLQLIMPKPEETPLCFRIYMVYDPQKGSAGYFTVEYDNFMGETAFLCGWAPDMTHLNYGGWQMLDPESADYAAQLEEEAYQIAGMLE